MITLDDLVYTGPTRSLQLKTRELIDAAVEVLEASDSPMTLRQCYYQLVSKQVIENSRSSYERLGEALVEGRKQGLIPWSLLEDRTRKPRTPSMYDNVRNFADVVSRAYRRDVWATQPSYFEVWLEKDALSGIFEDELEEYGVTLNVGRGFDGWSSVAQAAVRAINAGKATTLLYYGDFDPSGECMPTSLLGRIRSFYGSDPVIERIAILKEDIALYNLPPDFAKRSDSRAKRFIAKYGDEAVELDALPAAVLRDRLIESVRAHMDLEALSVVLEQDEKDRTRIKRAVSRLK